MRIFQRLTTRDQFSEDAFWNKGYTFIAHDVSDILVCEKGKDGDLGRMHLRSACRELTIEDEEFGAFIIAKHPKLIKNISEAA